MGPSILELPNDIIKLYNSHYDAVRVSFRGKAATLAGLLYVSCCQGLTMAVAALLRRHSSQAFRETRVAIEAAGIAHEITKDPESLKIFADDRGNPESRKAVRHHFKSKTLFREGASSLLAAYNKASELSHRNRRSLIRHIDKSEEYFNYQDLSDSDIPLLANNYLLWICSAHVIILEVADCVFSDNTNDAVTGFRNERQLIRERVARFCQKNQQDSASKT